MILSRQTLLDLKPLTPFIPNKTLHENGMSYGLSQASYDVRIDQPLTIGSQCFALASTFEYFKMLDFVAGQVLDKSSWARQGLSCFNTWIDPGFEGFMTLELVNHGYSTLDIKAGEPIAQIVFFHVDQKVTPYMGKYQYQHAEPIPFRAEVA